MKKNSLVEYLAKPDSWSGTEVFLKQPGTKELSVLHYNELVGKFLWRPVSVKFDVKRTRVGHRELIRDLVKDGWVV